MIRTPFRMAALAAVALSFTGAEAYARSRSSKPLAEALASLPAGTEIACLDSYPAGLSFYLTNFASYNEVYGSIGAIIGLLLWLYISAYLILLGAALNVHVHHNVVPPKQP